MSIKINLGCGRKHLEGYINIDINPNVCPDIIRDLNKGLPFSDNSIDEVVCLHFLEHVKDIQFTMYEIWRVLKDKGRLMAVVPIGQNWQNWPEHCAPFNANSTIAFTQWNVPEDTGYCFQDEARSLVKPEGQVSNIYEELHFSLIKRNFKPRKNAYIRPEKHTFEFKLEKEVKNEKTINKRGKRNNNKKS